MKLDVLLLTRSSREDYGWIYRPDYVDSSADRLFRPLLLAIENQANMPLFEKYGEQNLIFHRDRNYCLLISLHFTNRCDVAGRKIYTLEGFACKKSEARKFWKAVPCLVEELYGRQMEDRYYFLTEELAGAGRNVLQAENPRVEDYLRESHGEHLEKYKNYDYSFLNMLEETSRADKIYSFIYGNQTEFLRFLGIEHTYQLGEDKKTYALPVKSQENAEPEEEKGKIYFLFRKCGMGYQFRASVILYNNEVAMTLPDVFSIDRKGKAVHYFLLIRRAMEKEMLRRGYYPDRIYGNQLDSILGKEEQEQEPFVFGGDTVYEETWNIRITKIKSRIPKSMGKSQELQGTEKLFLRIYQCACRIEKTYFGKDDGYDTLYLLNRQDGYWIFRLAAREGEHYIDGCFIQESQKEQAWLYLEEILEKYIFGRKVQDMRGEFEEAYSRFLSEAKESLHPENYIISTIPGEYLPRIKPVKIYTVPGMQRLINPETGIEITESAYKAELPKLTQELRNRNGRVLLCAPLLGKKWSFLHVNLYQGRGTSEKDECRSIHEIADSGRENLRRNEGFICDSDELCRELGNFV